MAIWQPTDPNVGKVIKRTFSLPDSFELLSVNPLEPYQPITVARAQVERIWPVRGILFERALGD
jgi:hypothetical protein